MSSITQQELADELREAWVAVSQSYDDAMRALRRADHPAVPRLEAYVEQVFEPHSRMLGMRSI